MDLSNAKPSRNDGPTRVGMHSVEGFGKTTFLAHWPNALIVGAERGIPRDLGFSVDTVTPGTWLDVFDIISDLRRRKHHYGTIGFDTMDWIEPLIYRFVTDRDSKRQTEMNPKGRLLESIEDYGFGKGYLVAEEEFRKLITELDILQAERGMHVVMLMHSHTKTFKNPNGPDFDRWEPKCQSRIARVVVEYVEHMLFGFFQIDAAKIAEDKERHKMSPDRARAKGISTGVRLIGAQQGALYDAKNRVGLPGEFEYGHPEDLIKMLLGENLSAEQRSHESRPRGPEREAPQKQDTSRPPAQSRDDQRGPIEGSDAFLAEANRRNDQRISDNFARDAARNFEPAPTGDGVPANHESRRADEDRRRDDAFNGAKESARTLEQQRVEQGQQNKAKPQKSPLDEARNIAFKVRGDKYLAKIDGWVDKAQGDPDKIRSIINQVHKDCPQPNA